MPEPVTVPRKVPSTRYSRDHGELVSDATGSMDSFCADTASTQPSGEFRVPGVPDGMGEFGAPGAGAALATGVTLGSAGGSARPTGAVAAATMRQMLSKVADRSSMRSWRLSVAGNACGLKREL